MEGTQATLADLLDQESGMLECTTEAAESAQRSVIDIASLIAADRKKVLAAKEATAQAIRLFEILPTMPRFTTTFAADKLGATFPTARTAIKVLQGVGILECHHLDH